MPEGSLIDLTGVEPSVEEVVGSADIIARVRIVHRRAVREAGAHSRLCGYAYDAVVRDPIKHARMGERLHFFARFPQDFSGFDRDYLAVLSTDGPNAKNLLGYDVPGNRQKTCNLHPALFAPSIHLGLYAFEPRARGRLAGDWLTDGWRSGMSWCNNPPVLPPLQHKFDAPLTIGRQTELVRSWTAIRAAIVGAMQDPTVIHTAC